MSDNKNIQGIDKNQEVNPEVFRVDIRTSKEKFDDFIQKPDGFVMLSAGILAAIWVMPLLLEPAVLFLIWLIWYVKSKPIKLPFRLPKPSQLPDFNDLKPGSNLPYSARGISYFGNEKKTNKEVWFNNDDLRTHILVFGSTGAGKTETLVSLAFNSLVHGSGFIYVDGKGDNSLFLKIFSMCRATGRELDLLVINYMNAGRDVFGPQEKKLSNTLNPFASGSTGGLTELLVSLMDDSGSGGSGDMWKGRAISLISAIMFLLCWKRDRKEILLDVDKIREFLVLDNIVKEYKSRRDMPSHIRNSIRSYLLSLPGFQEQSPKQSEETLQQHGYLQMQFTKILGSLADTYGYIFRTPLGEVSFEDVVLNRRILVVLLPALEKSEPELANLGKIIVACLKQMMAKGLGSDIEGNTKEIIDTKPTNYPAPFACILDEYGYYSVRGAAVMAAQARSLGFSMIYAGQDYPGFEKASKEEAAQTLANTNVKIFMKIEDPDKTFDIASKTMGEAYVASSTSYEKKSGAFLSGYARNKGANIELKKRADFKDLKSQGMGEMHIVFGSQIVRADGFFANPPKAKITRANYFVQVEPPDVNEIQKMDNYMRELMRKLSDSTYVRELADELAIKNDYLAKIKKIIANNQATPILESTAGAVAIIAEEVQKSLNNMIKNIEEEGDEEDEKLNIFGLNKYKQDKNRRNKRNEDSDNEDNENNNNDENSDNDEDNELDIDEITDDDDEDNEDSDNDEDNEDDDDDDENDDDDTPIFLNEERTRQRMEEIERIRGIDEEIVKERSQATVEEMKRATEYPKDPPPSKEPNEIMDILKELDDNLKEED